MSTGHIRVPLVVPGTRPDLAEVEARILAAYNMVSRFLVALNISH